MCSVVLKVFTVVGVGKCLLCAAFIKFKMFTVGGVCCVKNVYCVQCCVKSVYCGWCGGNVYCVQHSSS